jgi:capsular polysaccharide biosynthesis protein
MTIDRFTGILRRQWVVVAVVLAIGLMAYFMLLERMKTYSATATILGVAAPSQNAAALDPQKDPTQAAVAPQDLPSLISSSTVVQRVGRDLHLSTDETSKLAGEVKARPPTGSNVIQITVTDRNPRLAIAAANAFSTEIQVIEREIATSRYGSLIDDLQSQLRARRDALTAVESKLTAVSAQDPYVTTDAGTTAINTQLVATLHQRDAIRAAMQGDASAAQFAGRRPDLTRALASREIIDKNPTFNSLREQYGKDLAQLNVAIAGYTEAFPGLDGQKSQVGREGKMLSDLQKRETAQPAKSESYVAALLDKNKADAAYASDRAQLATFDAVISDLTQHLNASRGSALSVASLRRERDSGNQAYARLSDRLAAAMADRSQAAAVAPAIVIDRATSARPSMLSQPHVLGAALAIAFLWLAFTLAFLVDVSDKRLRTRTTIEELYGSPVLTDVG